MLQQGKEKHPLVPPHFTGEFSKYLFLGNNLDTVWIPRRSYNNMEKERKMRTGEGQHHHVNADRSVGFLGAVGAGGGCSEAGVLLRPGLDPVVADVPLDELPP